MKKLKLLLATLALLVGGANSVWAQKDVTSKYITNATLKDGYNTGWTSTGFHAGPTQGNNTTGYTCECWAGDNNGNPARSEFSLTQNITLPAGSYRLVNYSFYRQSWNYDSDATKSLAYLKAGNQQTKILTLGSIAGQASYAGSMAEAANRFETKMYRNVVEFTVATDNTTVNIGVVGTHDAAGSWFICGMFELFDLNDKASVSSPTDMTYAIKNPGFEYGNMTGWTNTAGCWSVDGNNNLGAKSGAVYVEKWLNNIAHGSAGSFTQTIPNMPAGLYELSVYARNDEQYNNSAAGTGLFLTANSDRTEIGSLAQYKVRTTLQNDGDLTVGITWDECTGSWIAFDRFELKFFGDPLKAYQVLLDEAVAGAQALIDGAAGSSISATAKAAWQAVVDENDNDDNAFTQESQFTAAIENITNANTNYQAMAAPYATWLKVKAGAAAMASVSNTNAEAATTLNGAISTQNTAAEAALTAAELNTAISNLRTAIKTFISAAEPTAGNKFEITCLVENPSFDDNTISGWTRENVSGGNAQTTYTCNEFWNNTFDFYQNLADLPSGSYQLSVQAFSRPGGNGVAYPAYVGGTNSVTAELYVNNDASTVGNIYAYTGNTTGAKVASGSFADYKCVVEGGTDYWVPNGMEGASLYFADENVYKTEVAALVEDGNLRIGFRDETLTAEQWTIFDNFRLYYYGSDKTVYYQQYLPQLIAEVTADLSNGLYANVAGKELYDLKQALAVDYSGFTTEQEFSDAIQAIKSAQTAFRNAYPIYDALVAAKAEPKLTKISANIGEGIFQYNSTTNDSYYSDYETAYATMMAQSTAYPANRFAQASIIQMALNTLNGVIEKYLNQPLNAPATDKRYVLSIVEEGKDWNGNAVTFIAGARTDMGLYGIKYLAPANTNLNQALMFTAVTDEANTYKVSAINAETGAEQYITTGNTYEGGSATQIRTTDDANKASWVKIQATTTDGQFQLLNVSDGNKVIANNNNNDMYTANTANFTIAEAAQAKVNVAIAAGVKYGTRIFPFTPTLDGVEFYSCEAADNSTLTLVEVSTPAADTPYIIFAEGGLASTDLTGWGVAGATTKTTGWLTGVYTQTDAPVGSYVLQNNDGKVGFYKVAEGKQPKVGVNRCYLTEPAGDGSRSAFFFGDEEATAIEAIDMLTSGEAEIFNAAGARVPALQKGVNIVRRADGKSYKVIVK